MAFMMMGLSDLQVIKEGYVDVRMKGVKGIGQQWKRRYLVVTKAGIVDIFKDDTRKKRHKGGKGGFHLQGGETVEPYDPKTKKVNYGFQIIETKGSWEFACTTEALRNEWVEAFKNVLKQLNALIYLQRIMNKPNHDTLEGKLELADALAKCGQLAKARRIFSKLIVDYNDDDQAHRGFEEFLVKSCHDIYQAESHFVRRIRFLVIPKEFLRSREGQSFVKIAQRIAFFEHEEHKDEYYNNNHQNNHKDYVKEKQIQSILPDSIIYAQAKNLENTWQYFLFKVEPGHLQEAKLLVKNWIKRIQYNQKKFEYSYEEIESRIWDLMFDCSNNKKGTTRLKHRLDAVRKSKQDKQQKSKVAQEKTVEENTNITRAVTKNENFKQAAGIHNSNKQTNNIGHKQDVTLTNPAQFLKRAASESIMDEDAMDELDDLVDDILDDYDLDEKENDYDYNSDDSDENNNIKNNNQSRKKTDPPNRQTTVDLILDSITPEIDDDEIGAPDYYGDSKSINNSINYMNPQEQFQNLSQSHSHTSIMGSNRGYDVNSPNAFTYGYTNHHNNNNVKYINENVFDGIVRVLDDKDNHIFPWTALMLVWMMRRDNMTHIGGHKQHEHQIRAVLEFVYLFARGCFAALQTNWEYTMLLTSLYHNAVDGRDPEDVKQKLCLQAVSVIGDEEVPFSNKKAVFDFLAQHKWLQHNQENVHKATTRNFFLKGIRVELQRIQDELESFYEIHVYKNAVYPSVIPINDKTKVSPIIIRQDHDKLQGKCTWGPRKGNTYDRSKFKSVCGYRSIIPPKPSRHDGNFDEAYMLFCIELGKALDPFFQKRVKQSVCSQVKTAVHYPAPVKAVERCYHKITHDLQHLQSPRASRILDYCRCVVTFSSLSDLKKGFEIIEKAFRLCKVVNTFKDGKQINVENYQYLDTYVLAQHPTNQFVKLVCEIRLTLQKVRDLDFERRVIRDCFESNRVLSSKEITSIMKDIARESRKNRELGSKNNSRRNSLNASQRSMNLSQRSINASQNSKGSTSRKY